MRLKLAARRSDLARLQAYMVGDRLQSFHPDLEIEYQFKESLGDVNLNDPLWKAPEKGLFTEDFYADLAEGRTDLVVHSWKDLPIVDKPMTFIAATLERADARDVLLFKKSSKSKRALKILSSSPRRNYNLSPFFRWSLPWQPADVEMAPVRGNIPTRMRKLVEGDADGLVLAKAALDRMFQVKREEFKEVQALLCTWLSDLDFQVIPHSINPPCAGQGALAIEIRRNDTAVASLLKAIHCEQAFLEVQEERGILKRFGGGCHQKIGVWIHHKPYGKIQILKGITDEGEVLNSAFIEHSPRPPAGSLIFPGEGQRMPISCAEPQHNGLIVSRIESLPENWRTEDRWIWSAGIKTWEKLAQRGVWVHGSFDGLGEEPIDLPFLKEPPNWLKLTHSGGAARSYPHLATYSVSNAIPAAIDTNGFYFWRSVHQFEEVIAKHPEIAEARHACGPGATYHNLLKRLKPDKVFAFLNESDWRRQCQS